LPHDGYRRWSVGWPVCMSWSPTTYPRTPNPTREWSGSRPTGAVGAGLIASGYTVHAVDPLQVARYRERHGVSGAKSDPGDAHALAELVRLDRAHPRSVAGDSEVAKHVKILTRTHQSMIWSRQRQTNTLRSMLRGSTPAHSSHSTCWPAGTHSPCWRPRPPRRPSETSRSARSLRRCSGRGDNGLSLQRSDVPKPPAGRPHRECPVRRALKRDGHCPSRKLIRRSVSE
jgi:hypothetical protein